MNIYNEAFGGTTYDKIKGQARSLVFWYIICKGISKLITLMLWPILKIMTLFTTAVKTQVDILIPKTEAEKYLENREGNLILQNKKREEDFKEQFDKSFETWKKK